ncbi:hypothetical protein [Rhizobium leguminosarum]|uniref:hypothetical protein n=1 Tax=Rhizobium leguminosarum TaxID=384 RepID=UPI001F3620CD|nr:hypothetical protein [Rhizobium leguminosarum]UIJ81762.1 hypothetical protein LZK78_10975 [Rhizobium leguminosarum]
MSDRTISNSGVVMDTLGFLYSGDLSQVKAMPCVPVPGYPRFAAFPAPSANEETDTAERFRRLFVPDFLREFDLGDGKMAVCNKRMPHSVTDTMIIQSDVDVRSRYRDLSEAQRRFALAAATQFVNYVSDPSVTRRYGLRGGYIHVTYNTSAETLDRENGMGYTKRFHLHLNYWRKEQFAGVAPVSLQELSSDARNELLDPFTEISAEWLKPLADEAGLFAGRRTIGTFDASVAAGLPPGFAVEFPDWNFLSTDSFSHDLGRLQDIVFEQFAEVQEAFTGRRDAAAVWTRHPLLPVPEIVHRISSLEAPRVVRDKLAEAARRLRSVSPDVGDYFRRHKGARTRNLLMNGANFSVGVVTLEPNFEPSPIVRSQPVWLMLQFKMLSTLGSAGVFCNGLAPIVRIARNSRELTNAEEDLRVSFQKEFADRLAGNLGSALA